LHKKVQLLLAVVQSLLGVVYVLLGTVLGMSCMSVADPEFDLGEGGGLCQRGECRQSLNVLKVEINASF